MLTQDIDLYQKGTEKLLPQYEKVARKDYNYIRYILAGVKINKNMGRKLSPRVELHVCM
jgi:hypothetical protein